MLRLNIYAVKGFSLQEKKLVMFSNELNQKNISRIQNFRRTIPFTLKRHM